MSTITDRQVAFIKSLAAERTVALGGDFASILAMPCESSRDASALIDALKRVPRDPVARDEGEVARIDALRAAIPTLSPRDAGFALSLVDQYDQRGRLSERQWPHVDRLAAPQAAPVCDPQPGDIVALPDGQHVLIVAGRSGRPYGKVITASGREYDPAAMRRARTEGTILTGEALRAFAAAHGQQHAWCCFCGLELTDDVSVRVGYGPVCAAKHGLPHS